MYCTNDFRITKIDGNKYKGIVEVEVSISDIAKEYILKADKIDISTRSRLARLGSHLHILENKYPWIEGNVLKAIIGYINYSTPIIYHVGDEVGRFYVYNDDEKITGKELEKIVVENKIPGEINKDDIIEIELTDNYYIPKKSIEIEAREVIKNPDKYIFKCKNKDWSTLCNDVTILETKKIKIPSDVFGLIIETTYFGSTFHLNSRVIDPGWEGNLIVEVRTYEDPVFFEKPKLLVELYKRIKI